MSQTPPSRSDPCRRCGGLFAGADEEGTLERLKALRREVVDPKIAEHKGRIVKTTGDGINVAARLEALAEPGGICMAGWPTMPTWRRQLRLH
jgi:class 3 adenylate cyclase